MNWYKTAQEKENESRWKKVTGKAGDAKICHVDGNYVRSNLEIEYCLGGHHYRYDFIPEDEIWIENLPSKFDMDCNLLHEVYERLQMKKNGLGYEEAHEKASAKEKEYRETRGKK